VRDRIPLRLGADGPCAGAEAAGEGDREYDQEGEQSGSGTRLPDPPRRDAIANLGPLVAPGGTLLVNARARDAGDQDDGPPWALTRAEIDAIAASGLRPVRIEDIREPESRRWRAEFVRPAAGG